MYVEDTLHYLTALIPHISQNAFDLLKTMHKAVRQQVTKVREEKEQKKLSKFKRF